MSSFMAQIKSPLSRALCFIFVLPSPPFAAASSSLLLSSYCLSLSLAFRPTSLCCFAFAATITTWRFFHSHHHHVEVLSQPPLPPLRPPPPRLSLSLTFSSSTIAKHTTIEGYLFLWLYPIFFLFNLILYFQVSTIVV